MSEFLGRTPWHIKVARGLDRYPWAFDALFIALPLTLVQLLISGDLYLSSVRGAPIWWPESFGPTLSVLRFWVTVAMCAILAVRRIWPVLIAWTMVALALCSLTFGATPDLHYVAVPITVYTTVVYAPRRWGTVFACLGYLGALLLGGLTLALLFLPPAISDDTDRMGAFVLAGLACGLCAAIVSVAWLLGDIRRRRRNEATSIRERNDLLEREREHEARLAADAERLRIAREMHDIVSHSMSVMIAQSDGGRFVAAVDPARAQEAFRTIGDTGREALTQMRQMLGVLRSADAESQSAPLPQVADLPDLVGDVRAAGVDVDLLADLGSLPELTSGAGLAVYRIVQEALTNTLKHAGPGAHAAVRLTVDRAEDALLIRVDDSGPAEPTAGRAGAEAVAETETGGAAAPGPHSDPSTGDAVTGLSAVAHDDGRGSGLRGMDERARLYGGTVAHTADPSGFHITALLPLASIERTRA
ncbi:histidine kinase [Brevibacterium sp. 91QC2O2]|uniref:sensor histidine kinase n=1 Tax=Brevibacterium sp. 91QC2O2 TaxID=2968458 RepID=UPI00211C76FC|nr:histidine kinase [Brevibacterium sp. 91QC2O2]MCQ9367524.1 histidine kinase [Brevibacterium sp. 91QC2O2]